MINYYDYLTEIGISEGVLRNRVDEIVSYYSRFYDKEQLNDIFVSDYINQDGNRNYTSLWLIFENRICEAKNFITETDIDSTTYQKNQIHYWNLKSKECITEEIKDTDRLFLDVNFNSHIKGEFKAAKSNCTHLLRILKKYFAE